MQLAQNSVLELIICLVCEYHLQIQLKYQSFNRFGTGSHCATTIITHSGRGMGRWVIVL